MGKGQRQRPIFDIAKGTIRFRCLPRRRSAEVFYRKAALKNFAKFTCAGKTHKCFPVNLVEFSKKAARSCFFCFRLYNIYAICYHTKKTPFS